MNAHRVWRQLSVAAVIGAMVVLPAMADPITLPDPKVYWNFDEGSGSVLNDVTGQGYNGIIYGARWVPGVMGTALEFTDTDIVRFIPASFDDSITTAFTATAWVKYCSPGTRIDSLILDGRDDYWTHAGFEFYVRYEDGYGRLCFHMNDYPDSYVLGSSPVAPNGHAWTHLAVTFDDSSNEIRLYVNGLLDTALTTSVSYHNSSHSPAIGNNHWAPGDGQWAPFNGSLDELRLYNRALTADQVWKLYSTTPEPASLFLVASGATLLLRRGCFGR